MFFPGMSLHFSEDNTKQHSAHIEKDIAEEEDCTATCLPAAVTCIQ